MADIVYQGGSGIINKQLLGNKVYRFDHARDPLRIVDVFRHEMPAPIVGVVSIALSLLRILVLQDL